MVAMSAYMREQLVSRDGVAGWVTHGRWGRCGVEGGGGGVEVGWMWGISRVEVGWMWGRSGMDVG